MTIKKPNDCSKDELELFRNLVLEGEQVDPNGLLDRIQKCFLLGFYYNDENELIGVSAIKKSKNSVQAVKSKANVAEGIVPEFELGYSVTKMEFRGRGINKILNDKLLDKIGDKNIYATTGNNAMRRYLTNKGFIKKGESFKGKYNDNLEYYEK